MSQLAPLGKPVLIITLDANFQGEKRQGEGAIADCGLRIADCGFGN